MDFEKNHFYVEEVEPLDATMFTFSSELQMKVAETVDAFFFDTVLPYCSTIERRTVTKDELIRALRLLREQEQKERQNAES